MSRTTTADFDTQVASERVRPIILTELEFDGQTLYLSTDRVDLDWNSQTWLGNGWLSSITPSADQSDLRINGASVVLAGVPSSTVSLALDSVRHNKTGKIYLGFVRQQESRENLGIYSEDFTDAIWQLSGNTIAAVNNIAPNGDAGCHEITAPGSSGTYKETYQVIGGLTDTADHRVGCFIKYVNYQYLWLGDRVGSWNGLGMTFSADSASVHYVRGTVNDYGIEDVGNGWFYCWLEFPADFTSQTIDLAFLASDAATSPSLGWTPAGTEKFLTWGGHLCVVDGRPSAGPSSYIKTEATAIPQEGFGLEIVSDPLLIFSGLFDSCTIQESANTSTIGLSYESRAILLNQSRGHRWTHESQQNFFLGDNGFEYVPAVADWRGYWGKPEASP